MTTHSEKITMPARGLMESTDVVGTGGEGGRTGGRDRGGVGRGGGGEELGKMGCSGGGRDGGGGCGKGEESGGGGRDGEKGGSRGVVNDPADGGSTTASCVGLTTGMGHSSQLLHALVGQRHFTSQGSAWPWHQPSHRRGHRGGGAHGGDGGAKGGAGDGDDGGGCMGGAGDTGGTGGCLGVEEWQPPRGSATLPGTRRS